MTDLEEVIHCGVHWRRKPNGDVAFYDQDGNRWVKWAPGVDSPPVPPGWVGVRPRRPPFMTRWRLIPLALTIAAVVIAVVQAESRGSPSVRVLAGREAAASAALLGRCLAQDGAAGGQPRYSASPVACDSKSASVKVVKVVGSTPGSPSCPAGTASVELPYPGVRYPHVECVAPARMTR